MLSVRSRNTCNGIDAVSARQVAEIKADVEDGLRGGKIGLEGFGEGGRKQLSGSGRWHCPGAAVGELSNPVFVQPFTQK
jgi:hypothetical protein